MTTLYEILQAAKTEYKEQRSEAGMTDEKMEEHLYEIAANHVPIYYFDVIEVVRSNISLALSLPECGICEETSTPMSLMMDNIHASIKDELRDYHESVKEE